MLLGLALFETIAPLAGSVISDPCTGSNGQGFSFLLNPLTGSMSSTPLFDTNDDGKVEKRTGRWRRGNRPVAGKQQLAERGHRNGAEGLHGQSGFLPLSGGHQGDAGDQCDRGKHGGLLRGTTTDALVVASTDGAVS